MRTNGQTDRHDDANLRFSKFLRKHLKTGKVTLAISFVITQNLAAFFPYSLQLVFQRLLVTWMVK